MIISKILMNVSLIAVSVFLQPAQKEGDLTPIFHPSAANHDLTQSSHQNLTLKPNENDKKPSSPENAVRLSNGWKKFAFDAFHTSIQSKVSGTNTVFSPLSLAVAMSMVWNGSQNKTRLEIGKPLGYSESDLSENDVKKLTHEIKLLSNRLQSLDPAVHLEIANGLWASALFPVTPSYRGLLKSEFSAEVANLNFKNAEKSLKVINSWVDQKTHKLIPQILDSISPQTILTLVNTTYLKAPWEKPFKSESNYKATFTSSSANQPQPLPVNMMTQTGEFQHFNFVKEGFEAIKLSYGNNQQLSMVVLLPKKLKGLPELANHLNDEKWREWMKVLDRQPLKYGKISLPKHEVTYELAAKSLFQQLGIHDAFIAKKADLTPMFGKTDAFVSDIKHKAVIKVNEKGTEAAAATAIGFAGSAYHQEPTLAFDMNVNHGFISIIQEDKNHLPLFITTVDRPDFKDSEKSGVMP
jgi:serine protease inhibitor